MILNGFDGLVTMDKNLIHQQNLNRFDVVIFILNATNNKLATLKSFVRKIESYSGTKGEHIVQISVDD